VISTAVSARISETIVPRIARAARSNAWLAGAVFAEAAGAGDIEGSVVAVVGRAEQRSLGIKHKSGRGSAPPIEWFLWRQEKDL
jgi:hypothetical protein